MDRSRIGIIIPALNESATIAQVVKSAASRGIPIVVDDGSTDTTGDLAAAAGARVVCHESCRGYDQALNSGFARASALGCEYLITMDADGQHDPGVLSAFIRELDAGADAVIGIRDKRQRIAEHIFAWISKIKWTIRDPLCGMKAYRIGVYRELGHFDSYGSIGTELALFAARRGKRIAQVAVKTRDRVDQPRFGRRYQANKRIMRALWVSLSKYN
jgi:glycosyltransferase involved in cell wall biosynthesis